ncbi:YybH family protein [Brenneria uluponensis]|uniref:YybH family protein n=1 Tax=Brenneria uluponensis TaxID=3057057 RepID=UPI0028EB38FD|nr:nuclear transport factor 2 family protein [Brenneria ulupoensis]
MDHPVKKLIQHADIAITAEDFDTLMTFYSDDAVLIIKPELQAVGKQQIKKAFIAIAEYFNHSIEVSQGDMMVIESGDTALVIMETMLKTQDIHGIQNDITRKATYVFRKYDDEKWLCVIDNSYGTDLLTNTHE